MPRAHNRRTFLSWLGIGGAITALPDPVAAAEAGGPRPVDGTWDLAWTRKVRGKYRAVFDSPGVASTAIRRAGMWRSQYASVFGVDQAKLSAVAVVRHSGIVYAMNDAFWDEFGVAKSIAAEPSHDDEGVRGGKGNPSRRAIEGFLAQGGIVLGCNVAFEGYVVSKYRGQTDARKLAIDHLIPGVILQPSGPFAVMRAQDEDCHYMLAS